MELTEMQIDGVRDEVSDMLKDIFYDNKDREEVIDLIIEDVAQDIEETADWSNYDENEYNFGDIRIALARVLKNTIVSKYAGE